MKIECPNCHRYSSPRAMYPFLCSCGFRVFADGTVTEPVRMPSMLNVTCPSCQRELTAPTFPYPAPCGSGWDFDLGPFVSFTLYSDEMKCCDPCDVVDGTGTNIVDPNGDPTCPEPDPILGCAGGSNYEDCCCPQPDSYNNGQCQYCGAAMRSEIIKRRCRNDATRPRPHEGVGSLVHAKIKAAGYDVSPTCACRRAINQMNARGPQWCLDRIDDLADVMVNEAKKRRIRVLGIEPPEIVLRLQAKRWIRQGVRDYLRKQSQST